MNDESEDQEKSLLETISYDLLNNMKHSFPREVIIQNLNKEDISKLEKMYNKNTANMLQIKNDDDYIESIKECKKIFFNVDNDKDLVLYEEYENIQREDNLRLLSFMCRGLPKAASRLQILFKNAGNLKKCILWGLVSCYI